MLNFILIAVFITLGVLSQKIASIPQNLSVRLNQFVIYICLPAIVLLKIPTIQLDSTLLFPALIPWILLLCAALLVIIVAKIFSWKNSVTGCLLMLCCFGNTSFFGFPMVNAFFGEQGLPFAIVYDLTGSFLSLAIVGNIILAVYAPQTRFSFKTVIFRVVSFPPFIAILLALLLKHWNYPDWLVLSLSSIGLMLVPATMLLVGMHLSVKVPRESIMPLSFALASKLVILPALLGVVLVLIAPSTGIPLATAVSWFEAAMPPMVTASVMAIHADLEPKLAAAGVGLGLLLSCVSLPVWYWIITFQ